MNSNYLNQSYYQNIPSSQVNWAELAQRWIMAKPSTMSPAPPLDQNSQPRIPFPLPPPIPGCRPPFPPLPFPMLPQSIPSNMPRPSGFFGNWPPDASSMMSLPPFMPSGCLPPPNVFKRNSDNEEYKAHYDISLEQEDESTNDTNGTNSAPDGAMSHWFSGYDETGYPRNSAQPDWVSWGGVSTSTQGVMPPFLTPEIDHQMRKKLPAWILEGLEKAEKEKQKKLEKELEKKKLEEAEKEKEVKRAEKGRGKFDSETDSDDSEVNENDDDEQESSSNYENIKEQPSVITPNRQPRLSNFKEDKKQIEVELTLEERKLEALLAMKQLMTIVLLEATDCELQKIAKDCLTLAKRKARPKLLASSDALSALSSLGGDDDDDDDEGNNDESNSEMKKPLETLSSLKRSKKETTDDSFLRPSTPEAYSKTKSSRKSPSSESRSSKRYSSSSSHHNSHSSSSSSKSSHSKSYKSSRRSSSKERRRSRFRSRSPSHHKSSSKKKKF